MLTTLRIAAVWMLATGLLPLGSQAGEPVRCSIRMTDVSARSGITFLHRDGGSGQGYIVEGVAGGLALFDYDGDGLIDIYFTNGAALKGTAAEAPLRHALYRNLGDFRFQDVTERAGVADMGFGLGVTVGDYDNDGDQDLYLNHFGPNVLYRNDGDGTFSKATEQAGVGNGDKVGAGACFLDLERDGDLDLYVANYVDFTYENHVPVEMAKHRFRAGPRYYRALPDTLFRNHGDGTFQDVSQESRIGSVASSSMGMVCGDLDDDGDADVFVCNDEAANFYFENDGNGRFTETALLAGLAYNFDGKENSSMGVDCGDYDNDGRLDLFMTDYQSEMPVLYHNLGGNFFEDATSAAGITNDLFPHVHWGTGLVDFDNDGDRDLFVACGHFDQIELIDDRTSLRVANFLLMNKGNGKFVDVSRRCGDGLAAVESSRGAGFEDLDNDGDLDVVVLNANAAPTIIRNDSDTAHHWVQFLLRGTVSNRDGVGARVSVFAGDLVQTAEVHSGRSYQGHYGTRLHFGLAQHDRIDRVEIRWPRQGTVETFPAAANQLLILSEGAGQSAE